MDRKAKLEMTKMKLTARLTEAEAAIDNLNAKLNQVEKAKGKIASEIAEMTSSLDQAQVLNAAMDRKAKQFDKVIGEWKGKVDRLSFDLEVCLRGDHAPAGGGPQREQDSLQRDQGHHGPDQRGWTLHPRDRQNQEAP